MRCFHFPGLTFFYIYIHTTSTADVFLFLPGETAEKSPLDLCPRGDSCRRGALSRALVFRMSIAMLSPSRGRTRPIPLLPCITRGKRIRDSPSSTIYMGSIRRRGNTAHGTLRRFCSLYFGLAGCARASERASW